MGKRQLGQLQPFEIVITVMVSELAALPMQDNRIPLIHAAAPIITLLILEIITSYAQLKSEKMREYICGKPSILIKDGKINVDELKYQKININDLFEELRLKGFYNIDEVYYAILETNGQISVIPKTNKTNLTKQDLNIPCRQESLPVTLILDGRINYKNLTIINKDLEWLQSLLIRYQLFDIKKIFFAVLDSQGDFFYQLREEDDN